MQLLASVLRQVVSGADDRPPRILHVEDDPDLIVLVGRLLEGHASVVDASSVAEVKARTDEHDPISFCSTCCCRTEPGSSYRLASLGHPQGRGVSPRYGRGGGGHDLRLKLDFGHLPNSLAKSTA